MTVVVQNERENVLHVCSFKLEVSIPKVIELEVILKAMHVALSFEWKNVCLKTDAQTVNPAIIKRDRSYLHWAANLIFDDILLSIINIDNIFFV